MRPKRNWRTGTCTARAVIIEVTTLSAWRCGYTGLEFTDSFWTVVGVANAKKTVEAGFTTIRNVGSANFDDVAIKQRG